MIYKWLFNFVNGSVKISDTSTSYGTRNRFAPGFLASIERTFDPRQKSKWTSGHSRWVRGAPWQHSTMDRIAQELADLADADLDRIAAVIDALTGALTEPLTAWVRHLVDQERDGRVGKRYPLRPASDVLEPHEYPACIEAAKRMRDSSIDLVLAALLGAVAEVLEDYRARGVAGIR